MNSSLVRCFCRDAFLEDKTGIALTSRNRPRQVCTSKTDLDKEAVKEGQSEVADVILVVTKSYLSFGNTTLKNIQYPSASGPGAALLKWSYSSEWVCDNVRDTSFQFNFISFQMAWWNKVLVIFNIIQNNTKNNKVQNNWRFTCWCYFYYTLFNFSPSEK